MSIGSSLRRGFWRHCAANTFGIEVYRTTLHPLLRNRATLIDSLHLGRRLVSIMRLAAVAPSEVLEMKRWAIRLGGNALLVVFSIILTVALLEFLVRTFFPAYDPSGQVKFIRGADGTVLGPPGAFRQTKNTGDYDVEVRSNDWGLRDEKLLTAAQKEDFFVVGDSFAFGWGVNSQDRFSNRLQAILNRPVFNISIGGGDFDGYHRSIRYAEANGAAVQNLIVSVTMENDLHIYDNLASRDSTPSLRSVLPSLSLSRIKAHLTGNSALYVLATRAVHQTTWLHSVAVQLGLIRPNLEGIGDENVSREALRSSAFRLDRLVVGRNAVIVIIPSRRLWAGE